MECNHSIIKAAARQHHRGAHGRANCPVGHESKFVILDSSATPAATVAALAAVTLVLGAVYWLLEDHNAPA